MKVFSRANKISNKIANWGCVCIFPDPTFNSTAAIFVVNRQVQALGGGGGASLLDPLVGASATPEPKFNFFLI